MTMRHVLCVRFTCLVYYLPTLLVWIVGLRMAIWRLKRNRVPAIRMTFALGGLLLTWFILEVVAMTLEHFLSVAHAEAAWLFHLMEVLREVLGAPCWILILLAIFAGRPPDAPATERAEPGAHTD